MPKKNQDEKKIPESRYFSEASEASEGVSATQSPITQAPSLRWPASPKRNAEELVPDSQPGTPVESQSSFSGCTQFVNVPDNAFYAHLRRLEHEGKAGHGKKTRKEQQEARVGPMERPEKGTSLTATFSRMSPTPGLDEEDTGVLSERARHEKMRRNAMLERQKMLDRQTDKEIVEYYERNEDAEFPLEPEINFILDKSEAEARKEEEIKLLKRAIQGALDTLAVVGRDIASVTMTLEMAVEKLNKLEKK